MRRLERSPNSAEFSQSSNEKGFLPHPSFPNQVSILAGRENLHGSRGKGDCSISEAVRPRSSRKDGRWEASISACAVLAIAQSRTGSVDLGYIRSDSWNCQPRGHF